MSHDLRSLQGSQLQTLYVLFNNVWVLYIYTYIQYIYVYIYIYMILVIFHCQMWQYCCERADLFSLIFKKKKRIKQSRVGSTGNRKWQQQRRQVGGKKAYFVATIGLFGFKSTSVVIVCNPGSGWLRLYSVFSRLRKPFFTVRGAVGHRKQNQRGSDGRFLGVREESNKPSQTQMGGKKDTLAVLIIFQWSNISLVNRVEKKKPFGQSVVTIVITVLLLR